MIYQVWTNKKINFLINHFGAEFFKGKKILDIGSGSGEIPLFLADMGALVTCVDARKQHLDIIKAKNAKIRCVRADLDQEWPFHGEHFDLTLCFDVLHYLMHYDKCLQWISHVSDRLVFEFMVCDSTDPSKVLLIKENRTNHSKSFNGTGSRPSAALVEHLLHSLGFKFTRLNDDRCNHGPYFYDWMEKNNGGIKDGFYRLWICEKQTKSSIKINENITEPTTDKKPTFITQSVPVTLSEVIVKNASDLTTPKEVKKKVAICISGHLRSIHRTLPSIRKFVLDQNDCDVFISTWTKFGFDVHRGDGQSVNQFTSEEFIRHSFNPKDICIEPQKQFDGNKYRSRIMECRDPNNVLSMYYKIKSANDLKIEYENQNNFTYEFTMRLRPDLLLEKPLNLIRDYDPNFLWLCQDYRWGAKAENDKIAFGGSKLMDAYSSCFDFIEQHWKEGCTFHPETLLGYHVSYLNLPVKRIPIPYYLVRADGHMMRV